MDKAEIQKLLTSVLRKQGLFIIMKAVFSYPSSAMSITCRRAVQESFQASLPFCLKTFCCLSQVQRRIAKVVEEDFSEKRKFMVRTWMIRSWVKSYLRKSGKYYLEKFTLTKKFQYGSCMLSSGHAQDCISGAN